MRQQHRHAHTVSEEARFDEDRTRRVDLGSGQRIERVPHRIALHDADRDQIGIAQGVIMLVLVLVVRHRRLLHAQHKSARVPTALS